MSCAHVFRHWRIRREMVESLEAYRDHGREPGSFLMAILCNDLVAAVAAADEDNMDNLPAYADFLYNHMPVASWGDETRVRRWALRRLEEARRQQPEGPPPPQE